ncbi:MAG: hypothetical protein ABI459_10395 [Deltaproteobacteria bacterium]
MKLVHSNLQNGIWQVHLTGSDERPSLDLRIGDQRVQDFNLAELPDVAGGWNLTAKLPGALMSQDAGLLALIDLTSGNVIGMLQIAAGPVVADDQSAEIARLRQELDVLKEVVRKHLRTNT